jgi:hypothetical protein
MLRTFWCVVLSFGLFSSVALAEDTTKLTPEKGEVWTTPVNGKEKSVQDSVWLEAGASIRTGKSGRALLTFKDGSEMTLQPMSRMKLSPHSRFQQAKRSVILFLGRLLSKVQPQVSQSYEVKTANAVCGVRGTQFETAVADDGTTLLQVQSGKVGMRGDEREEEVVKGQQLEGDERGLASKTTDKPVAQWEKWRKDKKERLYTQSKSIVVGVKRKIMDRNERIKKIKERQWALLQRRKKLEERANRGDRGAVDKIRALNKGIGNLADQLADLGDEAAGQFAMVDHFADLASDPRFDQIDRKYLVMEAASLRRVKEGLDKMVREGTNISMKSMEKMLDDMGKGKGDDLMDDMGSSGDELFGPDE